MYHKALERHIQMFYQSAGESVSSSDSVSILSIPPNYRRNKMWSHFTIGLPESVDADLELFIYSRTNNSDIKQTLTNVEDYIKSNTVELEDVIPLSEPWLPGSKCKNLLVSLPHLEGEALERFNYRNNITHLFWLIPITEEEKRYREEFGIEALEHVFEEKKVQYANVKRQSLV